MKKKNNNSKLPLFFKPILWSYKFSEVNPNEDFERIIVNTINYGNWEHWQWVINYYGRKKVKQVIKSLSKSEFRIGSFRLISLILGIKKMKYETRGAKIRAERNI